MAYLICCVLDEMLGVNMSVVVITDLKSTSNKQVKDFKLKLLHNTTKITISNKLDMLVLTFFKTLKQYR